MGIFDAFTGSGAARAGNDAAGLITKSLATGADAARGNLAQGQASNTWRGDQAMDALKGGAQSAVGHLTDQFGNAINTTFQGGQNALAALGQGRDASLGAINSGYGAGIDTLRGAMDRARGYYDPYMQSGQQYNSLLSNALGANGATAQQQFYQDYRDQDPFRAENEDLANAGIMRAMNAQGLGGSGREGLAVGRASLERGAQDMNRYLDRLQRGAETGGQYAGQLSGIEMQGGQGIAGLESGRANALDAANRSYSGSMSGVYTDTANRAGGLAAQLGTAQANNANTLGSGLAGIYSGLGGADRDTSNALATLAWNQAQGTGKAQADARLGEAAARQAGFNNLLSLGGLALKAATGAPPIPGLGDAGMPKGGFNFAGVA